MIIHAVDGNPEKIAKLITLNEPGTKGIRVRYTNIIDAALMVGYIFHSKCRYGLKILNQDETKIYLLNQAQKHLGEGI